MSTASYPSPGELRGAALEYAARGVPVLPLRGKLPVIAAAHGPGDPLYQQCHGQCGSQGHGVHDATTNPDQLLAWWERWPRANVGLRTGIGFDVIDVDGAHGRHSLERWLAEHGGGVPIGGPRVRTGSGGWHLYVAPTGLPDRIGVLPSVDYRAADRYVVAPPSHHPTTGRRYQWVPGRGLDTPLGEVPAALRERLTPQPLDRQHEPAPTRPAEPGHPYGRAVLEAEAARIASARGPGQGRGGERNQVLWEAARNLYNLVAGGVLDEATVAGELERAAGACGLLRDEPRQTQRTLASARQVGMAHPRGVPERPASPGAGGQDRTRSDASHHPPFHPAATPTAPASADRPGARTGGDRQQQRRQAGRWRSIPARNRATAPDPTAQTTRNRRQTVGPTPTLPPYQQPPPSSHQRRSQRLGSDGDRDLVLGVDVDQPPVTHAVPAAEPERDGDLVLEETGVRPHRELAEADPTIRTAGEPEPLGRRLPQPLDASRQGVER